MDSNNYDSAITFKGLWEGCWLGKVESVTVVVALTGPVILVMCSQSLLTLSECWLVPRYPSTGHRWAEWGCWGQWVARPWQRLSCWHTEPTRWHWARGVTWADPGLTQWSPSHCYDGTVDSLRAWVEWQSKVLLLNVKPVLVIFLWKSLTRYCYLSHCPWFVDCVNSLISWHRHNTMTTIRGRVTCDFRK